MMCELLRQQAAPELEINILYGNPIHFDYLMAVFKEVVENKVTGLRGRLTCLSSQKRKPRREQRTEFNYLQNLVMICG